MNPDLGRLEPEGQNVYCHTKPRTIVGEVSVNWCQGEPDAGHMLSCRFETLIAVNERRGYRLDSWQLVRAYCPEQLHPSGFVAATEPFLNETIVAVFKLEEQGPPVDVVAAVEMCAKRIEATGYQSMADDIRRRFVRGDL